MPLPPALDHKIRSRFDELIDEGNDLIARMTIFAEEQKRIERERNARGDGVVSIRRTNYGYPTEYQAHVVKVLNLIELVLGNTTKGHEVVQDIRNRAYEWDWGKTSTIRFILGTLHGLKNDYENGFLDTLEERIVAGISADYMTQVDEILAAGQSDNYDHIFAAVICGVNLENALRQLCSRQSPPIETAKPNRRPKRLGDLIAALQKANLYNALKGDQLRAWAKVRNHAAHGEFEEFNRNDVEDMVKGVRNFLADYL